jgi:hypothetical protein
MSFYEEHSIYFIKEKEAAWDKKKQLHEIVWAILINRSTFTYSAWLMFNQYFLLNLHSLLFHNCFRSKVIFKCVACNVFVSRSLLNQKISNTYGTYFVHKNWSFSRHFSKNNKCNIKFFKSYNHRWVFIIFNRVRYELFYIIMISTRDSYISLIRKICLKQWRI